jgi:recombination protein RecA
VLDLGTEKKIVSRTGTCFRYGDLQLGQGKEKARQFLKENPKIAQEIRAQLLAAGGLARLDGLGPKEDDLDPLDGEAE